MKEKVRFSCLKQVGRCPKSTFLSWTWIETHNLLRGVPRGFSLWIDWYAICGCGVLGGGHMPKGLG